MALLFALQQEAGDDRALMLAVSMVGWLLGETDRRNAARARYQLCRYRVVEKVGETEVGA